MSCVNFAAISARREEFFSAARKEVRKFINPDGTGNNGAFRPRMREAIWILPAFYHGSGEDIALANRMIVAYNKPESERFWNVFQSNLIAGFLATYNSKLTPEAREAMEWHANAVFKTYGGSAQPDLKFHGCNDNMPMMSTKALILGGEAMNNEKAFRQGVWNLNEFRRLLSRSAWESEFNSSTYSPITLASLAQIANVSGHPEIRELAKNCEIRIWAELLLHWHPGTKYSGGPQCRAYAIDMAGHNHTLQALFWLMFGPELTGRDIMKSYFAPDGKEVIHFRGNYVQSIAEYCDVMEHDYYLPEELAQLIEKRKYPAITKGRSECMSSHNNACGEYHTYSYMEEDFSLGTSNIPLCSGDTTAQLYATYKRKKDVRSFRDAAPIFYRYTNRKESAGTMEKSDYSEFSSEQTVKNLASVFPMQKKNTAMLVSIPCKSYFIGEPCSLLKMDVIFPAHFGRITASIIGNGKILSGAQGESEKPVPVSVEAGEVYVHIQPLIPTSLPRKCAVRFAQMNNYEALELINYEGPEREFQEEELFLIQNGFVLTIDSKSKYESLEAFHRLYSDSLILDYTLAKHRFLRFKRKDVQYELCYTPVPFGVQTHAIDGRTDPQPVFETNQLDVNTLPFMTGEVELDEAFFPWGDSLKMTFDPSLKWQIGSKGLPEEASYSRIIDWQKEQ